MTQFHRLHTPGLVMARLAADIYDAKHHRGRKRYELTSEQKMLARRMAHEAFTTQEIYDALGVQGIALASFHAKLSAINVHPIRMKGASNPRWDLDKYGRIHRVYRVGTGKYSTR
jgi:hypothetical protein